MDSQLLSNLGLLNQVKTLVESATPTATPTPTPNPVFDYRKFSAATITKVIQSNDDAISEAEGRLSLLGGQKIEVAAAMHTLGQQILDAETDKKKAEREKNFSITLGKAISAMEKNAFNTVKRKYDKVFKAAKRVVDGGRLCNLEEDAILGKVVEQFSSHAFESKEDKETFFKAVMYNPKKGKEAELVTKPEGK